MKLLSNKYRGASLSALAITPLFVLSPAAFAVTAPAQTAKDSSVFCTNIGNNTAKITSGITAAKDKVSTARNERATQLTANRAKWDQDLSANRSKADQDRQSSFAKLEAKATTDAQKAAVKTYESTVADAVTKRRAANDAARTAFRNAVDTAIASQKATIDAQATIFSSAVSTAVTTAQAACIANPANGPAIRTTLQNSLKTAKDTYNAARKSDGNLGEQIKQLAATRNEAIKTADTTLQATVKAAREALKAAFGSQTNI